MVPATYVRLQSLPLTPNGKLDRKALPAPEDSAFGVRAEDPAPMQPRTPTELALARIWREMLGRDQVGVRDNFFDLGGHSLLAVRVVGQINRTFAIEMGVNALFRTPTIEAIAASIEQGRRSESDSPRLITFQAGHAGLPIYFVGAGPVEYRIAQSLGGERAIHAIEASLDPLAPITMEELGTRFGDALHGHAGASPCVIVGYSFKAKVAFEAARALQRTGGNVPVVVLIEGYAWSRFLKGVASETLQGLLRGPGPRASTNPTFAQELPAAFGHSWRLLWWMAWRLLWWMGRHKALWSVKSAMLTVDDASPDDSHPLSDWLDTEGRPLESAAGAKLCRHLVKSFRPRQVDAHGVLIRARFEGEENLSFHGFTNGWGGLFARSLEVIETTGDHVSLVSDERNRRELAGHLIAALDRYEAAQSVRSARSENASHVCELHADG